MQVELHRVRKCSVGDSVVPCEDTWVGEWESVAALRDDPDKLTDFLDFGGSPTEEVLRKELSHHHQDKFSGKFVDVWNEDRQKVSTFKEGNQQYKHMDLNDIFGGVAAGGAHERSEHVVEGVVWVVWVDKRGEVELM